MTRVVRTFVERLREYLLRRRGLVAAVQFAVTGERLPRRIRLLAGSIASFEHGTVVDLGCGDAALLDHVSPSRYVGIDGHRSSLEQGRSRHAGPGRTFILAELSEVDLREWRGADVAVLSSVSHHLDDAALRALLRSVVDDLDPGVILLQDAEAVGRLRPLVTFLDDGDHLRTKATLEALLEPDFAVRCLWTYTNPMRSFAQFLLELRPSTP